jgi:hypothetical protein
MTSPRRLLLQTTLSPEEPNDWVIARFSKLHAYLASLTDATGNPLCQVTARDRSPVDTSGNPGDDPVLSTLDRSQFDQLWLFALDTGNGLSAADLAGIERFHQQGGGILTTRDHQDMGLSMCGLSNIGLFHYFNSQQIDPDPDRCCRDDPYTPYISWPNYHSGANGDCQTIQPTVPLHPLLKREDGSAIAYFPAHPHEGGVGVPPEMQNQASIIATGISQVTGRSFNLVVAAEGQTDSTGTPLGRVVAQSTFHHFVDYNWDASSGCPTFVDEAPGDSMTRNPQAIADIQTYVKNLLLWL